MKTQNAKRKTQNARLQTTCNVGQTKRIAYCVLLFLTLSLALYVWRLKQVSAENVRSFTISPPTLNLTLKPGRKTEKSIKITNQSEETQEFTVTTVDFIVTDKSGTPELLPVGTLRDNKYAASHWVMASPDYLTVPPGKSATTTLYIQVPADARPGGRYVAVAFHPKGGTGPEGSGAAINTVIGSLVYLTVSGPTKESATVTAFSVPLFSEYGPIKLTTEIKNLGDIHITPKATVEIKNLLGQKVFSSALENLNIFPGTSRIYTNFWGQKWLLGRYSANLSGYYGQKNNLPLMATATFWVIPYKLISIVVLAVVIAVIAFYYFKKRQEPEEVKE